ncbi:hypothetical protein QI633_08140 [Nocardioides sp. QY071]|uniref:hypothetical protein n=1 Tax=Nocardioides sp. QY071 TaxID=3044187 RepID=UPI00249A591A|nr:hypothetical protein [Nocardioides sp. QY071]WGY03722.1 hypothetical protein QI633_08140 [Nocardioides sp. QY071]
MITIDRAALAGLRDLDLHAMVADLAAKAELWDTNQSAHAWEILAAALTDELVMRRSAMAVTERGHELDDTEQAEMAALVEAEQTAFRRQVRARQALDALRRRPPPATQRPHRRKGRK